MSSMQNFLAWIKAKSKKAKTPAERGQLYAPVPDSPTNHGEGGFFHNGTHRDSVCRASMKLPPIPSGEVACQLLASRGPRRRPMMGVASLRNTDSPAHIYEEIPNHLVDEEGNCSGFDNIVADTSTTNSSTDSVNVTNLDFAQAKDFGSFVVVPIRSKPSDTCPNGVSVQHVEKNNNKSEHSDALPTCDISNTPQCHNQESVSSFYPAESCISSDSGVTDLGHHQHTDFSHCTRCRRPHGIFNGISLSHLGGELDPESLELQTYFNKQMLQQPDDHEGSIVDRFLIVPSRPELNEDVNNEGADEEVMANEDKDPVEISDVTQTEPHEGSDSNDTCNEYDLRSSDRSSTSQSRPGSYAFDSGSSLYAFSNNEKDGVLSSSSSSGISGMQGPTRLKPQESDSSNDTFSEYDLHASPEYEYYLSKASHNLWLKKDVMRVIRESESSEYETTSDVSKQHCSCSTAVNLDSISLTTVTSLSDLSLSDKDNAEQHKCHQKQSSTQKILEAAAAPKQCTCECQNQQGKPSRQRTKTKTKHSSRVRSERRQAKELSSSEASASDVPAWERPERKGSHGGQKHGSRRKTSSRKTAELYCLPDFSQGTNNLVEEPERLSCRATDFTPPQTEHSTQHAHKHCSAARQPPAAVSQPRLQPRRAPQQNRMLSDLMKMNHDRLLVLF